MGTSTEKASKPTFEQNMETGRTNNIKNLTATHQFAEAAKICEEANQPRRAFELYAEEALFRDAHAENTTERIDARPENDIKRLTTLNTIKDDYTAAISARRAQLRLLSQAADLVDFPVLEDKINAATITTIRKLINTYATLFETKNVLLEAEKKNYSNDKTGLLLKGHEERAARILGGYITAAQDLFQQALALCGSNNELRKKIERELHDFTGTYNIPTANFH